MKRRFTIYAIASAVALLGGENRVAGQVLQQFDNNAGMPPYTSSVSNNGQFDTKYTIANGTVVLNNNFGPGESGTITPGTGASQNSGYHSATGSAYYNPFAVGNGVITVGGTTNVVENVSNVSQVGSSQSFHIGSNESPASRIWDSVNNVYDCDSTIYYGSVIDAPEAPAVPDGTGLSTISSSNTPTAYTKATTITVDGRSKTSKAPWQFQQFYFLNNPWYYNSYILKDANATIPRVYYYEQFVNGAWTYTPVTQHIIKTVSYTGCTVLGGYVEGKIVLEAGSHIRLDATANSGVSIGAGSHSDSKATLTLPATHYSLMNDGNFDAASIIAGKGGQIDNLSPLGVNAVIGIKGNYISGATSISTNQAGGTILLGENTAGQDKIKIAQTTGAATVVKDLLYTDSVYTLTGYRKGVANVGNYGNNNLVITGAATMFSNVGSAGLQIYARNCDNCLDIIFQTSSPIININSAGGFVNDASRHLIYDVKSAFNSTASGHTTLRAGGVKFNAAHSYSATSTGDYWVHAVGMDKYNGLPYCGDGDILMNAETTISSASSGNILFKAKNNVHLQDIQYIARRNAGSVFIAADNNIKLQYGSSFHCDADTSENKARDLVLNFDVDAEGVSITSGGFAAVASDLIDVYKNMIFYGGKGKGMSTVPTYGNLRGANVSGYGLYFLTQANKQNDTARLTFHADARVYTQNQRTLIASPTFETYGNLDLNTYLDRGSRTAITVRTDSLIMHDSLIIDGVKTTFEPWSDMPRNMPVFKLGHQRFTPPFGTASTVAGNGGANCDNCYTSAKDEYGFGVGYPVDLDTIFVAFRNGASIPRLHTLVADHAKITFLTDKYDSPTVDAIFKADTFKIRNHVELFSTGSKQAYSGQLELVSEEQMALNNYTGIYTRHLHFEPVAPTCSEYSQSQLWTRINQMEVIPTTTLGGFGWLHASVNVQVGGNLFPGFASLGAEGNSYEQMPGVLKFEDARIDRNAKLKFSVGATTGEYAYPNPHYPSDKLGLYADAIDVDSLTVYDEILLDIIVRPEGLPRDIAGGGSACYPLIHYNSVTPGALNHIKLKKDRLTSNDHPSIGETYYLSLQYDTECHVVNLCITTTVLPVIQREILLTDNVNVRTVPSAGMYRIPSDGVFVFFASFTTRDPLTVRTNRIINGVQEVVQGELGKLRDGVYTYTIKGITSPLTISFGSEYYSGNVSIDGAAVWAYNDIIFIRVERDDTAKIYSIAGQLVRLADIKTGTTELRLPSGVYVVTLNSGERYKVVVK
ncbi:MAG: T9SS type A sorting domain-containing protein [Tannerella sp.]|jgi:hypothetical protein|nr:T9SS type A sorting domain-containing protein [Tannerella sp.]